MLFEILDDFGNVINTIIADENFVITHYPGHYKLKEIPEPEPVPKQYTQLEYQSLYTLEELVAIEIAAETDATIRVLQRLQLAAQYISLADPRTIQGMQTLVAKNLLTQARYDEIISKTYV